MNFDPEIESDRQTLIAELAAFAKTQNISHGEIARRCELHRSAVSRALSGRFSPEIDTLLKIAAALGLTLTISQKPNRRADRGTQPAQN